MMAKVRPSVAVPNACWRVCTGVSGEPDTYVRKVANSLLCETCRDSGDDCMHIWAVKIWKKTNNNGG